MTDSDRYRLAWLSARRRAATVTEVLEALATDVADLPITLILDEQRETVRWDHPDVEEVREGVGAQHNHDLLLGRTVHPDRDVHRCRRYPDTEFVHSTGPCTDPLEAEPVQDTTGHPRHTDDLRPPSILLGTDAGGRRLFDDTRPWWLCHRTGLVHVEGPCILRTNPLDLRAGVGPIEVTSAVRSALTDPRAKPTHEVTLRGDDL